MPKLGRSSTALLQRKYAGRLSCRSPGGLVSIRVGRCRAGLGAVKFPKATQALRRSHRVVFLVGGL